MRLQDAIKKQRHILPTLVSGAVLTALTLLFPQYLGVLEWLTMIPIFIGVYCLSERREITPRRAYFYGFATVYAYYFLLWHWIVRMYPMEFLGISPIVSIAIIAAAWFGLPLLQAFFGGWMFWIWQRLARRGVFERSPLLRPFVFAALWVIFEWSSTLGWIGVPWGRLALGQIKLLPMLQSASLFGSYFISLLLLLVNGLLAYAILYPNRAILCRTLALSLAAANLLFGGIRLLLPVRTEGNTVRVAVIQGNIDSNQKWSDDGWYNFRGVYRDLTEEAAAAGAELVIWPETTFPYELNTDHASMRFLSSVARESRVRMIVGAMYEDELGELQNVLYYVEPDGRIREEVYSKRHLVPFGEYVPMRELFEMLYPPLTELAIFEDMKPGEEVALFESPYGRIGSLICFDSIYEQLTLDSVREGAELLVLASNDSWFYDSVGVYMHQGQAQLRSIESGREMARAAVTGISSVISYRGELRAWIDPLERGWAMAEITPRQHATLYTVVGNLIVWLSIAFVGGVWGAAAIGTHRKPGPVRLRARYGALAAERCTEGSRLWNRAFKKKR